MKKILLILLPAFFAGSLCAMDRSFTFHEDFEAASRVLDFGLNSEESHPSDVSQIDPQDSISRLQDRFDDETIAELLHDLKLFETTNEHLKRKNDLDDDSLKKIKHDGSVAILQGNKQQEENVDAIVEDELLNVNGNFKEIVRGVRKLTKK